MRCLWLLVLAAVGCKGAESRPQALPQIGTFRHDEHLAEGLSCDACHLAIQRASTRSCVPAPTRMRRATAATRTRRPSTRSRASVCQVCHVSVDPLHKGSSPLQPYPQARNTAQLVASFNHKQHLSDAVATPSTPKPDCANCHQVKSKEDAYASIPRHDSCTSCHVGSAKPDMSECAGCHQSDGPGPVRRFLHHLENDVRLRTASTWSRPPANYVDARFCHGGCDRQRSRRRPQPARDARLTHVPRLRAHAPGQAREELRALPYQRRQQYGAARQPHRERDGPAPADARGPPGAPATVVVVRRLETSLSSGQRRAPGVPLPRAALAAADREQLDGVRGTAAGRHPVGVHRGTLEAEAPEGVGRAADAHAAVSLQPCAGGRGRQRQRPATSVMWASRVRSGTRAGLSCGESSAVTYHEVPGQYSRARRGAESKEVRHLPRGRVLYRVP